MLSLLSLSTASPCALCSPITEVAIVLTTFVGLASKWAFDTASPDPPPATNGKAERFIQTALREWAYAATGPTPSNATRPRSLALHYNFSRPHGSLRYPPPISRSDPGTTS